MMATHSARITTAAMHTRMSTTPIATATDLEIPTVDSLVMVSTDGDGLEPVELLEDEDELVRVELSEELLTEELLVKLSEELLVELVDGTEEDLVVLEVVEGRDGVEVEEEVEEVEELGVISVGFRGVGGRVEFSQHGAWNGLYRDSTPS